MGLDVLRLRMRNPSNLKKYILIYFTGITLSLEYYHIHTPKQSGDFLSGADVICRLRIRYLLLQFVGSGSYCSLLFFETCCSS